MADGFDLLVRALAGSGATSRLSVDVPSSTRRVLTAKRRSKDERDEMDRAFTTTWSRYRHIFERRWYSLVKRRTGYSGVSFVLRKKAGFLNYEIENLADYAPYVHPSGRRTPIMAKEARDWRDEYAREVAGKLRRIAQRYVREELLSTLARVRAASGLVAAAK